MKSFDFPKAVLAGFVATVVMTIVMYGLPLIGIPPMDIMAALGSVFPFKISPYILGALTHFFNGIVLALIYAAFFFSWLPGPGWFKGVLFSLLPWLFAITLLGPSLQLAARVLGAAPSPVAQPCAPTAAQPCTLAPQPCASAGQPCAQQAQPCSAAQPCAPAVQPCAPLAQPCAPAAQPCAGTAQPCAPAQPSGPQAGRAGGIPPQALSLIVHLIYGAALGALYRPRA